MQNITRLVRILTILSLLTTSSRAQLVIEEPFDYTAGALNGVTPIGTGLSGTWSSTASIDADSLDYGSLPASIANKVALNNQYAGVGIDGSLQSAGLLDDGAELWFSVLVQTGSDIDTNGDLGFAFGTDRIGSGNDLAIQNSGQALGFTFKNDQLRASHWAPSLTRSTDNDDNSASPGTIYLVVGKFTWGASEDSLEIYEVGTDLSLGTPVSTYSTDVDQSQFDTISIGSKAASPVHYMDEIRFGSSPGHVLQQIVVTTTNDYGAGSLRQAILDAESGQTIYFEPSLSGQTITLTSGQLLIIKHLTIDASFLKEAITISGNSNGDGLVEADESRIFQVASSTTVTLDSLNLVNGINASDAGAIYNLGNLTLHRCVLSGNRANDEGGAIYTLGDLTLIDCSLYDNQAHITGGAVYVASGQFSASNCSFTGNSCGFSGGAIILLGGSMSLNHCTITANTASTTGTASGGGGIYFSTGSSGNELNNSIVAGNFGDSSDSLNQLQVAGGTLSQTDNLTSGNPQLTPLGDYGGPTPTMHPLPGSPVIDNTSTTTLSTDQRGLTRIVGSSADQGAVESGNAIEGFIVNTATDENDGVGLGDISLRDAIGFLPSGSTITFDPGLSSQTIVLTSGQLLIDKHLTIDASALPGGLTVNGNDQSRIFEITTGVTATLNSLSLINGSATGAYPDNSGGAIYNEGTLTLNQATLSGNSAYFGGGIGTLGTLTLNQATLSGNSANFGGGIDNFGTLTLNQATLSGNSALNGGGGIYNNNNNFSSTLTLNQATLSGNSASSGGGIFNDFGSTLTLNQATLSGNSASGGGGIYNYGTLTLNQATLSGNSASGGGGIYNYGTLTLNQATLSGNSADFDGGGIFNDFGSTLTLNQAIVANNTATSSGPDIRQTFGGSYGSNTGVNFIGMTDDAGTIPGTAGTDYLTGDPLLAPLGYYGGPTQTMPPLPGSPVIDAGSSTTLTTDQRGAARSDGSTDIGAVEFQPAIVTTASDEDDSPEGAHLSLREAIVREFVSTITFDPSVFSGGAANIITLGGTQLLIDKDLTIDAFGMPDGITIDADGDSRIFEITTGVTATLNSLSLINGSATGAYPDNSGGAIYNEGTLTLNQATLSGNSAYFGGGIGTLGTLTLNQATLSGNSASEKGGGIDNFGTLTLNQATLSGNSASDNGGAIYTNGGTLTLNQATLSGNSANFGGGIYNGIGTLGTLTLNQAIVANNTSFSAGPDIIQFGSYGPNTGVNFIGNTVGAGTIPGTAGTDYLTGDPLLAPLGDYGGPTQTMPPLPGSPAIEPAGGETTSAFTTDQRGASRIVGTVVDIGAVEAFPLPLATFTDSEPDGIPDLFEGPDGPYPQLTVGSDDSAVDTDGDGSTDAEELANMTNLYDANDYFRILSFAPASGFDAATHPVFDITLKTFPGLDYEFQCNETLDFSSPTTVDLGLADEFTETTQVELAPGQDFIRAVRKP